MSPPVLMHGGLLWVAYFALKARTIFWVNVFGHGMARILETMIFFLSAYCYINQTFWRTDYNVEGKISQKPSTWCAFQSNAHYHSVCARLFTICWQTVNIFQVFVFCMTLLTAKSDQLRQDHMLQVTCRCHFLLGSSHHGMCMFMILIFFITECKVFSWHLISWYDIPLELLP